MVSAVDPALSRELPAGRSGSAEIMRASELNFLPDARDPDQPLISSQAPGSLLSTSLPYALGAVVVQYRTGSWEQDKCAQMLARVAT